MGISLSSQMYSKGLADRQQLPPSSRASLLSWLICWFFKLTSSGYCYIAVDPIHGDQTGINDRIFMLTLPWNKGKKRVREVCWGKYASIFLNAGHPELKDSNILLKDLEYIARIKKATVHCSMSAWLYSIRRYNDILLKVPKVSVWDINSASLGEETIQHL